MRASAAATRRKPTRQIVGIADMIVSKKAGDQLITYALGSCLGICIHDPVAQVGGLLHVMLPSSSVDTEKAKTNPARFVDTGVPTLFKEAYRYGAKKERIVVKVAGGASIATGKTKDNFQIGKRNFIALKKLLWKNGVLMESQDVGGHISRTVSVCVESGETVVKSQGKETVL